MNGNQAAIHGGFGCTGVGVDLELVELNGERQCPRHRIVGIAADKLRGCFTLPDLQWTLDFHELGHGCSGQNQDDGTVGCGKPGEFPVPWPILEKCGQNVDGKCRFNGLEPPRVINQPAGGLAAHNGFDNGSGCHGGEKDDE